MPYRALTHNRVKSYVGTVPTTDSQSSAINSQNGVSNSGSVTSVKNKLNISNKQPNHTYARTLSVNFLMSATAYGSGKFVSGQGKGFPNAVPQTSVGSTNTFARRAIARRAVTKLVNNDTEKNCPCNNPIRNLRGELINK